jgi:hypothetical protein
MLYPVCQFSQASLRFFFHHKLVPGAWWTKLNEPLTNGGSNLLWVSGPKVSRCTAVQKNFLQLLQHRPFSCLFNCSQQLVITFDKSNGIESKYAHYAITQCVLPMFSQSSSCCNLPLRQPLPKTA